MHTLNGTVLQPRSADTCDVIANASVQLNDDGKIAEVTSGKASTSGDAVGGEGCWILPGFIDAHLHVSQWDRRGLDGSSLFDWLETIVHPAEQRMADLDFAGDLAERFVAGMITNGTTTVAAFGSPFATATDRVFDVFARRGLRAIYGMVLNDMNWPDALCVPADEALDQSRELAVKWHGAGDGRLQYAFSPRMATCCSETLLHGVVALAEMIDCHIFTHVAESSDQKDQVRDRFPDYIDDVDLFDDMGLLGPRTLLGHGVCLSDSQRRQVAGKQASVVHCPTANLFLESGLMDYVSHRKAGIRIALGSSIAAGPEPFMPQVAVAALQTAKALKVHAVPRRSYPVPTPAEGWWLLTRGAAEALNMGDRIGAIESGYEADCLVVRPEPWIADLPTEQQVSALLYTLRPQQIEHVFIAGRRVGV